jgi:hypothetical protein
MTTTTLRSGNDVATHPVTSSFTDVTASISGAASMAGLLRNLSAAQVVVVKGGAAAPGSASAGELLDAFGAVYCDTDHIWVRSQGSGVTLAFEVLA